MRAIACLLVIGFHLNLVTRDMHIWSAGQHHLLNALILSGHTGVSLFFVLSGFLLFLPYAKDLLQAGSWPDARIFYLRRALRILPGYYASLFLLVVLQQPHYLAPGSWRDLLLFLTCFMDATPATFQHINGPYWTLAIEWQFYLVLPLIVLGVRGVTWRLPRHLRAWSIVACLCALMGWGILSRYWGAYYTSHATATFFFVPRRVLDVALVLAYGTRGKFLEDFACGMLAALCYTLLKHSADVATLRRMRQISPWLGAVALLGFLVIGSQALTQLYPGTVPLLFGWGELLLSLSFAGGMLAILFGVPLLGYIFAWAPLRLLGLISYSLYIWHLPLLGVFMHEVGPSLSGLPAPVAYSCYWLWVALVVIPFSATVYLLIEKPGIRLGERLRNALLAARTRRQLAVALELPRSS